MHDTTITPTEFVALTNQTLEYAYPVVRIVGELANFKVAKGKWIYADIKDEQSSIRLFGTVYQLPGPLEDGMEVEIVANPRLHNQFGFSLNLVSIRPVGQGSIKKASDLLAQKLYREGLFDEERKRQLPHIPERIALITGSETAAYHDFVKVLNARWGGLKIDHFESLVQGDSAPAELVQALQSANTGDYDAIVVIRGGGSADDLSAFSHESVVRAVAASRIPTLVAIGHEVDESLSELAADKRASTPSNAAELLVPDRAESLEYLAVLRDRVAVSAQSFIDLKRQELVGYQDYITRTIQGHVDRLSTNLLHAQELLEKLHPSQLLSQGFALVQKDGVIVRSSKDLSTTDTIHITMNDGTKEAQVQ